MSHLRLTLLGTFAATLDAKLIPSFRSRKIQALLAYLAVESARVHPRDALVDLLWPEQPPEQARGSFRLSLSRLQKRIGNRAADPPFLTITRQTVAWNPDSDYALDVADFLRAADGALNEPDSAAASGYLHTALGLYGGDFLAGFAVPDAPAFDDWAATTRQYLHQQLVAAITQGMERAEADGEFAQVADLAQRQLDLAPWDESAHQRRMRALALDGQRAAALAQFDNCIQLLDRELGVVPDEATVALAEQIRSGALSPPLPPVAVVPPQPAALLLDAYAVLSRLEPLPAQKLFGVDAALDAVATAVNAPDGAWLIAIDGLGGIGKTTLANALVHRLLDHAAADVHGETEPAVRYQDIAWVSAKQEAYLPGRGVQPTGRPALDAETLMDRLLAQLADGPYPTGSSSEKRMALTQLLKEKVCLVVVDNLETVVDYEALLPLLRHLTHPSKFLLTSRLSLAGQGDVYCHSLRELGEADALAFLRHEAESRGMTALLDAADAQLQAIYETVGGNPLALKLVLGQIQFLPLEQVLTSLRTATTGHAEQLYNYIYWQAWQMLDQASRHLLLTMPVTPNATFAQLQSACGLDVAALQNALMELRALSLVEVGGDLREPRYRLHRLTETFLLHEVVKWQEPTCLATSADARFFLQRVLTLIERWEADEAVQGIEIEYLDQEHEAILKALSFGLETSQAWPVVKKLIIALTSYMERRGHWAIWHAMLERALGAAQREVDLDGEITLTALLARLCQRESKPHAVMRYYWRVIRLAQRTDNRFEEARACSNLGFAYIEGGHWWRSEVLSCHALGIFQALESAHGLAHTHNHLGLLYTQQERWELAEEHLRTACDMWRAHEDRHSLINGYMNLGHLYVDREEPDLALTSLGKAEQLAQETGEVAAVARVWNNMAIAHRLRSDWKKASHYAAQAESHFRKHSDLTGLANVWHNLGLIVYESGDDAAARRYLEESLRTYRNLNNQPRAMGVLEDLKKVTAQSPEG